MVKGDKITGKIYYQKNKDNHRNVDIKLEYRVANKFGIFE